MCFCVICFTAESALPNLNKAASSVNTSSADTAANNSTIVDTKSALNLDSSSSSNTQTASPTTEASLATLPNGKAYIGVSTYLSVRNEPFGTVLAQLYNNDEVLIVSRKGDWYEIECDKGSGWIYGKCVFASPNSNPSGPASNTANISNDTNTDNGLDIGSSTYKYTVYNTPGDYTTYKTTESKKTKTTTTTKKTTTAKKTTTSSKSSSGSLQKKIVDTAKEIVKKYSKKGSFPYAPGLKGGVLGCAHVATTVLKKAGAIKSISYGCKQTIGLLQKAGWKKTKVPPYKAGDVIFWTQTDKKKSKGPTHVGIIMESGNNVQAMSNSSSQKRPRYHKANYAKVYCVMRKA